MNQRKTKAARKIQSGSLIRRLLLAFLLAAALEYLLLPRALRDLSKLDGLAQMSLGRVIGLTLGFVLLLWVGACFARTKHWERWGIAGAFALLAILALTASFTRAFLAVCLLALAILAVFALKGWDKTPEPVGRSKKVHILWPGITAAVSVGFFVFVSVWTVKQVKTFSMSTFDFGLFSQMFHYMRTTGLPLTTLERNGLLSHFAVHVSPIYYLMLPFYMVVPKPETLMVLQAAVMASAVIPLWKIGDDRGLSGAQRTLLCVILLLLPAFSGGASYGIHENCFLTPLLLWLFYAIDRKNWALTAVFAGLTLLVKEDAPMYVAVVGLYVAVKGLLGKPDREKLTVGGALFGVSLVYFFAVTGYLAAKGDGVMTYRYRNFMYDGSDSLLTVVKAVILNPMKAVFECVDKEKLKYIGLTLGPLLGLPLVTWRYERYILLIPYVLVNLLSDYTYQHDVFFQYSFGSTAFLLYLTAVNLADLKINWQKTALVAVAAAVSLGCFWKVIRPSAEKFPKLEKEYAAYYQQLRETLDTVPADVSLTTNTFLTTYLSQRDVIYDLRYCTRENLLSTEYVVLKKSSTSDFKPWATGKQPDGFAALVELLLQTGYGQVSERNGIFIFRRMGQG